MITINRRNTVQRTLILETVRELTDHPSADEIYINVLKKCPNISKGTVYRNLTLLADEGLIYRVAVANGPDRYDLTAFSHAHLRCRVCGNVYDHNVQIITKDKDGSTEIGRAHV